MIVVTYEVAETGWRLAVADDGSGQAGERRAKTTPGLGTSIVEALAKQLKAQVTMDMTSHGTSVSVTHGALKPPLPAAA